MRRSTSRLLFACAFVASVALSVRPNAWVERGARVVAAPTRLLAEFCAPLRWLRLRSAHAAQAQLIEREELEHSARVELRRQQRVAAEPDAPHLRAGRRFVHAEVIDRSVERYDTLLVRLDGLESAGLAPGMPVVHGENFVGRVLQLDAERRGHALVELVTARGFAVGARLEHADARGATVRCVVGGIAAHSLRGRAPRLALVAPSARELPASNVYVDEGLSTLAPYREQAAGFVLGRVEAAPFGEYVVVPGLDLLGGPFRVAIVAPDGVQRPQGLEPYEPLSDPLWAPARVLARSAGAREGFTLSVGALDGARRGAAFVVGSRLIGRVLEVDELRCSVANLADRGWLLPAVALPLDGVGGDVRGVLIGLGAAPDDARAFECEWRAAHARERADAQFEVQFFTGSGAPGVPSGLWLGAARVNNSAEPQRVRLETGVDLRATPRGFVRREESKP